MTRVTRSRSSARDVGQTGYVGTNGANDDTTNGVNLRRVNGTPVTGGMEPGGPSRLRTPMRDITNYPEDAQVLFEPPPRVATPSPNVLQEEMGPPPVNQVQLQIEPIVMENDVVNVNGAGQVRVEDHVAINPPTVNQNSPPPPKPAVLIAAAPVQRPPSPPPAAVEINAIPEIARIEPNPAGDAYIIIAEDELRPAEKDIRVSRERNVPAVVECNSISSGTPKMTKPEVMSLDLDEDMDSLKDRVTQFRIECADYFKHYKIPMEQWTQHAFHWTTGRFKRKNARKYAETDEHMTWAEFKELMEEMTQSTDTPQHHLRSLLVRFSMEAECSLEKGNKTLAYGIGKLEDIAGKIKGLDEEARCHALWNSLPERMKDDLQSVYDCQEGGNNCKALKKACLQRQEIFRRYLDQRRGLKRGREIALPSPPRSYPSVNAIQAVPSVKFAKRDDTRTVPRSSFRSPPPPPPPPADTKRREPRMPFRDYAVDASKVPQSERFLEHRPGRVACVLLPETEKERNRQGGKCVLCGDQRHYLRTCPHRESKFRAGQFFYCDSRYGKTDA